MKRRALCTVMDRNYLTRGLALYTSLERHVPAHDLYVLCMDRATWNTLNDLALAGLKPVALESVMDERLRRASEDRTLKEFSITCKSFFMFWLLLRHPDLEMLSFADSDIFFYSNPEAVFGEMGAGSVGITEHRFPARLEPETSRDCGIYNGGWVSVRRDARGMACLEDWSSRCLDWCYDRIEDGKYGDQKYLVDWPKQFEGVVVLRNKGANLAPWNVENYTITMRCGQLMADNDPVVFYHFSGLRQIARWLYRSGLYQSGLMRPAPGAVRRWIYRPYLRVLHHWERRVGHTVEPDCGFRTAIENRLDVPRHLWSGRLLWKPPATLW
jgi:hypothetical protein